MRSSPKTQTIFRYPISVENKGWVILSTILFFPLGLFLFLLNARIHIDQKLYYLKYKGSIGWLVFWLVFFFPVAFLLIVLNGIDLESCKPEIL